MKNKIYKALYIFLLFVVTGFPAFAESQTEQNNYIVITRKSVILKSSLAEKYNGFKYTIKNISDTPLTIRSVSIWDNSTGQIAYLSTVHSNADIKDRIWAKGKSLALPTLSTSLIVSGVAIPFATIKNSKKNKKALKESNSFNKKEIQNLKLTPGEEFNVKTLALKKYTPKMRLIYINPITDEDMNLIMLK